MDYEIRLFYAKVTIFSKLNTPKYVLIVAEAGKE